MFAIVAIFKKQYIVSPGDILLVDRMDGEVGESVTFPEVLLVSGDKNEVTLGKPFIEGASVTAKILAHEKGEKLSVRRYKSKVRYRKHIGFRPQLTKLEIVSLKS